MKYMSRDSSVGKATRYGLNGPGIESRWGPDRPGGPPSLLYSGYRDFPEAKAARAWHWAPTLSSAEVKEREKLYVSSSAVPSWQVIGWIMYISKHKPLWNSAFIVQVTYYSSTAEFIMLSIIIFWIHVDDFILNNLFTITTGWMTIIIVCLHNCS